MPIVRSGHPLPAWPPSGNRCAQWRALCKAPTTTLQDANQLQALAKPTLGDVRGAGSADVPPTFDQARGEPRQSPDTGHQVERVGRPGPNSRRRAVLRWPQPSPCTVAGVTVEALERRRRAAGARGCSCRPVPHAAAATRHGDGRGPREGGALGSMAGRDGCSPGLPVDLFCRWR